MQSDYSQHRRRTNSTNLLEGLELRRLFAAAYTLKDLTPDTRSATNTGHAYGISNNGTVAIEFNGHAAISKAGVITDLGFAGYATDVNDSGKVCGVDTSNGTSRPFVYSGGVKTDLTFDGHTAGVANAINSSGTVVGTFFEADSIGDNVAFATTARGQVVNLGVPKGYRNVDVSATGINDAGQIIGEVSASDGSISRSYVRTGDAFTLIATPPGGPTTRIHHGITPDGIAAVDGPSGDIYTDGTTKIYHVYTSGPNGAGALTNKGTLNNDYDISATDISAQGVITATIDGGATPFEAAVNTGGGFVSLNNLIDPGLGWSLFGANAVNDSGQIVGYGYTKSGELHAYQLTPLVAAKSSISGRVFNDTNSNGLFDAAESASGVRTVFIDANNNNKLDSGETSVQSAADGSYQFSDLPAGVYHVERVLPSGYHLSNNANGYVEVHTTAGQAVTGVDLGSAANMVTPTTGSIAGTVFNDTDADGIFDSNESASGARTVYIDANGNGKLDSGEKSTQSSSTGTYKFDGLAAGSYKVSRVFPTGYHLTGTAAAYLTITVASGQNVTGVNLGSAKNK